MPNPFDFDASIPDDDEEKQEGSCFMDDRKDVYGFDLSASEYDDLFAQHEQIHQAGRQWSALHKRYLAHMRSASNGEEIVQRTLSAQKEYGVLLGMKLLVLATARRDNTLSETEFWKETVEAVKDADPLAQEPFLRQFGSVYHDMMAQSMTGIAALSLVLGSEEEARKMILPIFVASIRIFQTLTLALHKQMVENLIRVANGCDEWDAATRSVTPGTSPLHIASFSEDGSLEAQAEAAEQQQTAKQVSAANDALMERLLGSMNFDL